MMIITLYLMLMGDECTWTKFIKLNKYECKEADRLQFSMNNNKLFIS